MSKPTQEKGQVIHLAMSSLYSEEVAIAKAWEKAGGDTKRRVVFGLPLQRLMPHQVIVPLIRGKERSSLRYEEWDPNQNKVVRKDRKPAELIGELHECKPVTVGEFWTDSGALNTNDDGFLEDVMGGDLDRSRFIDAIARSTAPYEVAPRTHHGQDNQRMYLTWS